MNDIVEKERGTIDRYTVPSRKADPVSNHVMCHIRFDYEIEREGDWPVSAKCIKLLYDTVNLDGREHGRDGRTLGLWKREGGGGPNGEDLSYQQWVKQTVSEQRMRLLLAGTITETNDERFRRLMRADNADNADK